MPHFEPQRTDASCSVASAAMVLRALLAPRQQTLSFAQLLALDTTGQWAHHTRQGGEGIDLDGLGLHLMQALFALGERHVGVDVVHMAGEAQNTLLGALSRMKQLGDTFIILNARQDMLFAGGDRIGHFVVVADWDSTGARLLLLDPDEDNLPPYWVKLDDAISAMASLDEDVGQARGFVSIRTQSI